MIFFQKEIILEPHERGFHLITDIINEQIPEIKQASAGMLNLFLKHTSASLTINENADPTVREDFETHFSLIVPDGAEHFKHDMEGPDDMPAHIKASLLGPSLTIPVTSGKLNLGTWQGVYLCEHRNYGGKRKLILTFFGNKS